MEQILDQFIAVALVFLLLSLIVKGIQDLLKYVFDNKERAMRAALDAFMGPNLQLQDILGSFQTVFGQTKAKFLENLTPNQFRGLLDRIEPQRLDALSTQFAFADINRAKEFVAQQFANALKEFQARYERSMGRYVFGLSLVVVVLCNANVISIYEEIAVNAATRQSLVALAEAKYREVLETVEEESGEDVQKRLQQTRDQITAIFIDVPIIMRGMIGWRLDMYVQDTRKHPVLMIPGLLFSAFLVYLGAPFWHDLLQTLLSAKNVLRRRTYGAE